MKVGFLFERWPVHRATISTEKSRENKTCKRHQETDERIGRPKSSEIFLDVSSKLPKTKVPDTLKTGSSPLFHHQNTTDRAVKGL